MTFLPELLRTSAPAVAEHRMIFYGALLVVLMMVRPNGLLGTGSHAGWLEVGLARLRTRPPRPEEPQAGLGPGVKSMALLELEGLTMEFGGLRALDRLDLRVERGEIVGIMGPNGAGKTTVFNVLTGLYRPSAGRLRFDGRPLEGLKAHEITALGIARTFQNIRLFGEMTVWENVVVGAHIQLTSGLFRSIVKGPATRREERAYEHLAFVGLKGWETHRARRLPYGAQRRLEIARALAAEPKLLGV